MDIKTEEKNRKDFEQDREGCDMLIGIDVFGKITFLRSISQKAFDVFGYKEEEVIGKQAVDFIKGATENIANAQYFGRLYASESAFRSYRRVKTKNGGEVILESYLVPMYNEEGKFTGHCGMEFIKEVNLKESDLAGK
ncbi:MAG: PAS domain-containing protein [Candidatus Pacebacteria bacterium]|nr:PAS domain-containing protein [Candidatus Paceibacterota bacterium]